MVNFYTQDVHRIFKSGVYSLMLSVCREDNLNVLLLKFTRSARAEVSNFFRERAFACHENCAKTSLHTRAFCVLRLLKYEG